MKIFKQKGLCLFVLAGALLCGGCDIDEMSSLKDLSRPYTGEYACKRLLLSGEDMLGKFDYVKLQLDRSGTYRLFYASGEEEGEQTGGYELSPAKKEIALSARTGDGEKTYVFPYEEGKISVELQFNEKLLYAEFSMASA